MHYLNYVPGCIGSMNTVDLVISQTHVTSISHSLI